MSIYIHEDNIDSGLKERSDLRIWLQSVIRHENRKEGDVNIILMHDPALRKINQEYLSRDYFTDIITFDLSSSGELSGDLYISLDRVKDNAREFGVEWMEELKRVMVHGILHLAGYNDQDPEEKVKMREREDHYLDHYGTTL